MRFIAFVIAIACLAACGDDDSSAGSNDAQVADAALDGAVDSDAQLADADVPTDELDASSSPDAALDASVDVCEQAYVAFSEFLEQHQSCDTDDECAVIGDCGPNADFTAIRADAAEQGYALMSARCAGAYDGPVYFARCTDGMCALELNDATCCGCDDGDAGL